MTQRVSGTLAVNPPNNLGSTLMLCRSIRLSLLAAVSALGLSSCQVSQEKGAIMGGIGGAAIGAALGATTARKGNRTLPAIFGGVAGAGIGQKIGRQYSDPDVVKVRRGD